VRLPVLWTASNPAVGICMLPAPTHVCPTLLLQSLLDASSEAQPLMQTLFAERSKAAPAAPANACAAAPDGSMGRESPAETHCHCFQQLQLVMFGHCGVLCLIGWCLTSPPALPASVCSRLHRQQGQRHQATSPAQWDRQDACSGQRSRSRRHGVCRRYQDGHALCALQVCCSV
jgi:hypothetical protein